MFNEFFIWHIDLSFDIRNNGSNRQNLVITIVEATDIFQPNREIRNRVHEC